MTSANWITLMVTVVGLAGTWGGLLVRMKMVEAKASRTADDLASSREKQGERLGVAEERIATLEGVVAVQRPRRFTRGGGTAIVTDDDR